MRGYDPNGATERERVLARVDALLAETETVVIGLRALRDEVSGFADDANPRRLCEAFSDGISAYARRPRITATWETEARRLLEVDRVTMAQALAMIAWLTEHDGNEAAFWRRNVLSFPTFRRQWDRLVLAMRQDAERMSERQNGRAARLLALSRSLPGGRGNA
jgi:hypothetical protein